MSEMRILTVRQPWAWAIIHGGKDVENRVRNIAGQYRGPVAIHAAKTTVAGFDAQHPQLWPFDLQKHKFGAIIGVVDLVGVHESFECITVEAHSEHADPVRNCSPWAEHHMWHLELANPRPLSEPIPFRGALGLRRLPDDVAAAVLEAVAS